MKKKNKEAEKEPKQQPMEKDQFNEVRDSEGVSADVNSIHEFLELKKLQNRILGKMLEKMEQTGKTNKHKQ